MEVDQQAKKPNFTQIMLDRWVKANQILPDCDKTDMLSDTTLINGGTVNKSRRQQVPEVT
jgi:hypothetical protein